MIVRGLSLPPTGIGHDPVGREKVSHEHMAAGLWLGLAAILLLPHPKGHKVKPGDIHKSYGIAMSVFGLT